MIAKPGLTPYKTVMRRFHTATFAGVLFAITFAVFARVLSADFVMWDDNSQLQHNDRLGGLSIDRIVWAFTDFETASRYIPLTLLGWIVTYQIWELNPFGYHLGNLLLHCGSVVVAFMVLRRLFRMAASSTTDRPFRGAGADPTMCAALGAAIWGLHPMRVEVVAWCTTRTYCQATFFALVTLWLYLGTSAETVWWRRARYWASLGAYTASMLSYPLAMTLPMVLCVLDIFPLRVARLSVGGWRGGNLRRCILNKVPFMIVAVGLAIPGVMARFHPSAVFAPQTASLSEFGILSRLAQACYLLVYYLWRPWWPVNLVPVRVDLVDFEWTDWPFLGSLMLVPAATIGLALVTRRWPTAVALWTMHVLLLLPVLGWTEHPHYPTDRYSTLQGMLWPALLTGGVYVFGCRHGLTPWAYRAGIVAAFVIVGVLSALTVHQTRIWRNSETLFTAILKSLGDDPYRLDVHLRLGLYYATSNPPRFHEAEQVFFNALKANPRDIRARDYLLRLFTEQQRLDDAIRLLRDGIQATPDSIPLRMHLGRLLDATRRFPEAIEQYTEVLRLEPGHADARNAMDATRRAMGLPPDSR